MFAHLVAAWAGATSALTTGFGAAPAFSAAFGAVPARSTAFGADVARQIADRFGSSLDVFLLGYELVGAVLGLFIAYQAYRGFRRNDSRPMFFIALGFVLVVGLPMVLVLPYLLVPSLPQAAVQVTTQTFEVAGLLCIIYGLRVES